MLPSYISLSKFLKCSLSRKKRFHLLPVVFPCSCHCPWTWPWSSESSAPQSCLHTCTSSLTPCPLPCSHSDSPPTLSMSMAAKSRTISILSSSLPFTFHLWYLITSVWLSYPSKYMVTVQKLVLHSGVNTTWYSKFFFRKCFFRPPSFRRWEK